MPKFFVKKEQITDKTIKIIGKDVNHIKNVLRMKKEEEIQIGIEELKKDAICKIEEIKNEEIICKIINLEENQVESNIEVTIYQGLPKSDKMELIIQKAVELGVYEIYPTKLKRCIVKLEGKDEKKKIERWQKISEVASKQSGRGIIPKIQNITNINEISKEITKYNILLVAYEEEDKNTIKQELKKLKEEINKKEKENENKTKKEKQKIKIGVLIGPEGGIDKEEIQKLKESGAKIITLGKRILRTETVALNVLSNIMYELEQ